jgi:hypothetical protein
LRKNFTELAKLDEAGIGIVLEIAFRQRTEPDELHILFAQEVEIGRKWCHDPTLN